ncbi:GCN5-related N-acetyltransferase [Cronobacter condimenti 1330]|uniref:GCN5-related N-acetyltransferase n=1 Tax=Cronobacter condimenti 1330 TaxID=1073999 RepID=K8A8X1_9ENTR|nr:GNAT family N-acetyltransferase [Cronobacter condimenti]ALB64875.1 GNAT family acetyltransferase [Cronobacter condimenti 1330]CCJ72189.1 GCN5-related N-acetyltransferase [Cronobacter condimenti 1330]
MFLQTTRLLLRPVSATDVDDLFRIYGDPATNAFNPAGPYPNRHHAEGVMGRWLAHWQANGFGNWRIALRAAPEETIGFGGLSLSRYAGTEMNNLGYRFATQAWGKGLATEFAQRAVRYGFEILELGEISAVVRSNHLASRKVLTHAGLQYVREIHDVKNAPPSLLYTLTRDGWRVS